MTRYAVAANDTVYTVSPLESPVAGNRHCALLTATLIDETTGRAPLAPLTVILTQPSGAGAVARIIEPARLVVTGKPQIVFVPTLATTAELALTIQGPGFIDRDITVTFACKLRALALDGSGNVLTLDSNAALAAVQRLLISTPDGARVELATLQTTGPGLNQVTLTQSLNSPYPAGSPVQPLPPDLTLELHRAPTLISGRVLKRTGSTVAPLAAAAVRVSKLWRKVPPAGVTVGPEIPVPGGPTPTTPWAPPIAAIQPPCYAELTTAASVHFEDRPLDATMTSKTLLDPVRAGATTVRLSDVTSMNPSDVLAIDADDQGRTEILEVVNITLSCTPSDWATVTLSHPLALAHAPGRVVRRLGAPLAGPSVALNYPALSGDTAVLFDTTGITGTHQVCIIDPGAPPVRCYHRLDILATTSDANGFYRLPPLSRAGKVEIAADETNPTPPPPPPPLASGAIEIVPDYTLNANSLDVLVS